METPSWRVRYTKWAAYFYCFFFITLPFTKYSSFLYGGTSGRSLSLVAASCILAIVYACLLFAEQGKGVVLSLSPVVGALVLYGGSMVLSGLMGANWSNTFWSVAARTTGVWYYLAFGFFLTMLWSVVRDVRYRKMLIVCIAASTALYSVMYLLSPEGLGLLFAGYKSDAFTFGNSSFAGMYLFGAFMLAVYYVVQAEVRRWWMYLLPLLISSNPAFINPRIWMGDFSTGLIGEAQASTYTLLLSLVALLGVWGVSQIPARQVRARVSYGILGVGTLSVLIAAYSLLSPGGYLRQVYLDIGTAARPLVWQMSEKAIAERPLLGWGGDNFERVFERLYDNRLLQDEYGREAWFDRAHNVFVDQWFDNGIVGLALFGLLYFILILSLIYVALNGTDRSDRQLAAFLAIYFSLHLLELQTAFETSISYPMLGVLFVFAGVLFERSWKGWGSAGYAVPVPLTYALATVLLVASGWSLVFGIAPLMDAQYANGMIRVVGSPQKRLPYYRALFSSPIDVQTFLWRTSTDFQRGIGENPDVLNDPKMVAGLKKELLVFEQGYRAYVAANPTNFRAHLNLADVLIYQRLFGVDKLAEAQQVLDAAILLVPESPQPYWMKAVAYVYMRKFDLAREYAKRSLALNPKIVESQKVVQYVEDSIRTFPELNLYFFKQI